MTYTHPIYTADVRRRAAAPAGAERRALAFAGAYHGWGFHEDGCRSGVCRGAVPGGRVVTAVPLPHPIAHGRVERVSHGFAYRHPIGWSTSTTAGLRAGSGSLGVRRSDHLGDPALDLRANVDAFLALHGVDLAGGRVLMLTNARSFGYVFNPLTVFWCYDRRGELVAVVAEVHNTYGDRHCYLLRPDARRSCRGRQGVLRVAVLPGRRALRDDVRRPARDRRAARRHRAAARDTSGLPRHRWRGSRTDGRGRSSPPRCVTPWPASG